MDLQPYVDSVREGVNNAAALADESSQEVARKLGAALDSSTRLALIQALSDAAGDISADLAPASVDVRINGGNPDFVVTVPEARSEPTVLQPEPAVESDAEDEAEDSLDDEPVARISLRLPASVKAKVDDAAEKDGISTNAWLMRAVLDALPGRRRPEPPQAPQPPAPPGGLFGQHGPFGPDGVFGPHGVFGAGPQTDSKAPKGRNRRGGNVQGWVR